MNNQLPSPVDGTYLLALIHQWFPNVNIVDPYYYYKDGQRIDFSTPITNGSIVLVDDEAGTKNLDKRLEIFKQYDDLLLLSADPHVSQILRDHGHSVLHDPFLLPIEDAISMRHLGDISIIDKFTGDYNFICLNKRGCDYKRRLLQALAQHQLIAKGYVTYHAEGKLSVFQFHHEDLRHDDLTHYTAEHAGCERHNHLINDVWCSSNVRNYLYISEKFTGHTMISSETPFVNFVTEKSFIALFCRKMPMVFSSRPIISMLQNEGFDCFTDIIDQNYDHEDTWKKKINLGIESNRELLSSDLRHRKDEIDQRTQYNYQHLLTHWLDRRLNMLKDNISAWLDS
jgi:hypothetical protein